MSHGIDIGRRLTLDEVELLRQRGYSFAARYYALDPNNPKCLVSAEVSYLLSRRLGIVPVFEETGAPPFDFQTGVRDGGAAKAMGLALGQPLGTPICFAIDTGQPGDLTDYFNGVYQSLDGAFLAGVYGDYNVVKIARENLPGLGFFWQTYAWSAGAEYEAADIYQFANGVTVRDGLVVDLNMARSAVPWRLA